MMSALKAIWDFVWGFVQEFFTWLRKPGSRLKLVCAILAFGFAVAGMVAFEKEQKIADLAQKMKAADVLCTADKERLQGDVATRDQRLAEVATRLREEAEKLDKLKAENAKALEELASEIDAANHDAATWRQRYERRPDTCKAALELLDSACPGLEGY